MAYASNWNVWYDRMPGSEPDNILHISADCHFDTTGNRVHLEAYPAGIVDGTELAFTLVVTWSDLPVKAPETVELNEEIPTDGRIGSVRISDDGEWTAHEVTVAV